MALSDIEIVNIAIGNTRQNPYYPVLTEEEVEAILDSVDGDVLLATKKAAQAAMFVVISIPSREKIGDIEIWNEYSANYLSALKQVVSDSSYTLPKGLMPYAGGIDKADFISNSCNPARKSSELAETVRETRDPLRRY